MTLVRSKPTSAVMTNLDSASLIRLARAGALNPEYTTLWITPMRAHASMAMSCSGNFREIDGDAVARVQAQLLQRVGAPIDLAIEFAVGKDPFTVVFADPDECNLILRQVLTCRSRQLYVILHVAPTNHLAQG